jgi:hypothetical protein
LYYTLKPKFLNVVLPCDSIFERTLAIFINFLNIKDQVL